MLGGHIPERLELAVGQSERLPLPSASGGGYAWKLDPVGGDTDVAHVDVELGPVPTQGDQPTSTQAPVTLVVAALRPGSAVWRLRLVRVWQPESPLVDRPLEIAVR